jgi:hypothetical protein
MSCCYKHHARLRNDWQTSSASDRQFGGLPSKIDEAWTNREVGKLRHHGAVVSAARHLMTAESGMLLVSS